MGNVVNMPHFLGLLVNNHVGNELLTQRYRTTRGLPESSVIGHAENGCGMPIK